MKLETAPWTDDRAWCRRLGAAGLKEARLAVLREWVEAAGGWSDAAVRLPDGLPNGIALANLRAHARALGLAIHDAPELSPSPELPPSPVPEPFKPCLYEPLPLEERRAVAAHAATGTCWRQCTPRSRWAGAASGWR